jgi:hypothetical protein
MTEYSWPATEPARHVDEHVPIENAVANDRVVRPAGWSVRRAIELLDAAIDRMGEQLALAWVAAISRPRHCRVSAGQEQVEDGFGVAGVVS